MLCGQKFGGAGNVYQPQNERAAHAHFAGQILIIFLRYAPCRHMDQAGRLHDHLRVPLYDAGASCQPGTQEYFHPFRALRGKACLGAPRQ